MVRLSEIRKEHGLSQKQLAAALSLEQTHISRWERGSRKPSADSLIALCKILKTSADYLLGLENDDGSKNY